MRTPARPAGRLALRIALAASVALAGFDFAWIFLKLWGPRATQWWSDLVAIPVPAAATVACWVVARREQGRARGAWFLLGTATFAWALGSAVWAFYELGLDREVPFPSVADAGFLGLIPLAVVGVLLFPTAPAGFAGKARSLFDVLVIVGSLLFVSWGTVLGPTYREGGTALELTIGLAYPIGDIAILSIVLFVAARTPRGYRVPFELIGLGLAVLAVADSWFIYKDLHGTYATGDWIDPLWEVGFLLVMLGAVSAAARRTPPAKEEHAPSRLAVALPYAAVAFVIVLAGVWYHGGVLDRFLFWNMLAVLLFVVGRQLLAVLENVSLARNLDTRVRQLVRAQAELVEGVSDYAIVMLDPDGKVVTWNAGAERITGYAAGEIVGRPASILYPPEDARAGLPLMDLRTAVEEGRSEQEGWRVRKDGSRFFANVVVSPLRDEKGQLRGFSTVKRDITERVRAQQEREELEAQLDHSRRLESLGQLAGGVAHDFNNLLAVILGFAGIAKEQASAPGGGEQLADLERNIDRIQRAAQSAASLTQQLLTFSRRDVVEPKVIDLNAVVSDLEDLIRRTVREGIQVRFLLAPALWPVKADPRQLDQVFINLAVNARDAMPGGGTLAIETRNRQIWGLDVQASPGLAPGRYAVVRVSDTGGGMSPEVAARAFEPFFTTKPKGVGTGLGLATVYGIVAQTGGTIALQTAPGEGTAFTLYFPATVEEADRTPGSPAPAAGARANECVLVVEDDDAVRELTSQLLERRGYAVLEARDAAEAMRILERGEDVDVLLTDVVMPEMSGPELIARARLLRPDLPAVCMSGYPDSVVGRLALEAGFSFVRKPFTEEHLLTNVRDALDAVVRQG